MKRCQNKIPAFLVFLLISTLSAFSCKDFVHVDPPETTISANFVFTNDETANAAVAGIYSRMNGFSGGFVTGSSCLTILCGLYADELTNYSNYLPDQLEFFNNKLNATNLNLHQIWADLYNYIYSANSIIEGLSNSTAVSTSLKQQLTGEALFMRAFCHFYLVNLYGDVPKITATDYRTNSLVAKSSVNDIYSMVISDLENAKKLLHTTYIDNQKTRVNQAVAAAFLSRVYLYHQDWENAEIEASQLIQNTNYLIEPNVRDVFLNRSRETIWQMQSLSPYFDTFDAFSFILTNTPNNISLSVPFVQSIPTTDLRKANWIGEIGVGTNTYYYPHKYKVKIKAITGAPATEELVVFRLAEQYLIRAEARAHLNKIEDANEDLNKIRNRAGLSNINADDRASLLLALEAERKVEFFAEWAHRWFDLKRTRRADAVLSLSKPNWKPEMKNFPIPQLEIQNNPNL